MDDELDENYLAHYGVPGMKWGQRKEYEKKGRKKSKRMDKVRQRLRAMGSQTVASIKKFNAEQERQKELKKEAKQLSKANRKAAKKAKNDLSSLSNEELKERIARIQLEAQYKQLTARPSDAMKSMVKKKVKEVAVNKLGDILGEVGTLAVDKAKKQINKKAQQETLKKRAKYLAEWADYSYADIRSFNNKAEEVEKLHKYVKAGGDLVTAALDTEKRIREEKSKKKDKEKKQDETQSNDEEEKKKKKDGE